MAITSVERSTAPVIFTRAVAWTIDCEALYNTFIKRVGTNEVAIMLRLGKSEGSLGKFIGGLFQKVPKEPVKLGSLFHGEYEEGEISITYTYGKHGYDATERLSRLDFVMQTLDIWERLYESVRSKSDTPTAAEKVIESAIETLKTTYSFQELMPEGFDMEQFKYMLDPPRQLSDGTGA